jgi:hypothetical protein
MTFFIGASLLLSLMIGVFLTLIFLPLPQRKTADLLFRLFVGGSLGIGVTACIYFVCLLTGLTRYIAAVDLAVCLGLGVIVVMRHREKSDMGKQKDPPPEFQPSVGRPPCKSDGSAKRGLQVARPTPARSPLHILMTLIFFTALASSLASFTIAFLKEPHGRWDAWLIWNMHARFLFFGGAHWREAFAGGMDWSHWDYPLLLPLSIARGWTYTGGEGIHLPAVMGFLFTFLLLGLLLTSLSLFRGRIQGFLGAMVLMGTPFFITMGTSQFADIPLAFFILTTLVMLFYQAGAHENSTGAVILAGLAAGLCAWTKNEGLLFFAIVAGSLLGTTTYSRGWGYSLRRTAWFVAGALPILLIVLYFKVTLAPTNDLVAGFSIAALSEKLFDPSRYQGIAKAFFITGISFTQGLYDLRTGMRLNPGPVNVLLLAAYLLITGLRIDQRDRTGLLQTASVLFLMVTGYFFVYVLTPLDLHYHLMTSLNRLFLQLWPVVIFIVLMVAGPPEPASLPGDGPRTVPAQSKPRKGQGRKTPKTPEAK